MPAPNPYSTRFVAWASESSPPPYVVAAGYVAIIRDLDVYSGGGSIITWEMGVAAVCKLAAGVFTIESQPQVMTWRGRQIVPAGEAIYFAADGATDGAISGYLLLDLLSH
jgi:hypothetical protein